MKSMPSIFALLLVLLIFFGCTSEVKPSDTNIKAQNITEQAIENSTQEEIEETPNTITNSEDEEEQMQEQSDEPPLQTNSTIQKAPEESITISENNATNESVADSLSFSWEKDSGSRIIDGSVPFVHRLKDGKVRLYYCNNNGILSAVSKDGITFEKENGIRISPGTGFESHVCDPTIVDLPDGKMRMYYKGANSQAGGPGQSIHKIYSAISSDGLTFQKEGLRIDSEASGDNGWASVPDAIVLPDGRVRIYYVTAAGMQHGIGSAMSSDGLNFVKEPGIRVENLVDPALIKFGDKYLLFAASIDERFARVPKGIYYLESSDGLDFGEPITVFQGDNLYDPSVLKIDENTIRVFYGKVVPPQLPAVESHTGILDDLEKN